jgi:hypothetical protein
MGSVVPGLVVTDPSGSVDVVGRIVVSDWLPASDDELVGEGNGRVVSDVPYL